MTAMKDAITRPLLVAEHFGPTLQGEGPSTGKPALFIRLSRCNLSCPACDTPYTWDWSRFNPRLEARKTTADALHRWAMSYKTELVVITGGEPLSQQDALQPLVRSLAIAGRRIEIETNGTIAPDPDIIEYVSQFNVSPKTATFAGSDATRVHRINPDALRKFASSQKAVFKFTVSSAEDLDEISLHAAEFGLEPVWIMPEGTTPEVVLGRMSWLAEEVIKRNWSLSGRLHILLWGDQRGR